MSLAVFALLGCATMPAFDTTNVDSTITPQSAQSGVGGVEGKTVLWGGIILDFKNLTSSSRMEILAYPLSRSHRPLQDQQPIGRFILLHSGFLEPTVYTQGKLVSAVGEVGSSQSGSIGETEYVYPVMNAKQIRVWKQTDESVRSSFHIGIGIGF